MCRTIRRAAMKWLSKGVACVREIFKLISFIDSGKSYILEIP